MTEDMIRNATKIINMGCTDKNTYSTLFVHNVIDLGIDDPKDKPIEKIKDKRWYWKKSKRNSQRNKERRDGRIIWKLKVLNFYIYFISQKYF